jgi:hypothetical protein
MTKAQIVMSLYSTFRNWTLRVQAGIPTRSAHRYTQVYFGRDAQDKSWTPESKIYFGRDVQDKSWTPPPSTFISNT